MSSGGSPKSVSKIPMVLLTDFRTLTVTSDRRENIPMGGVQGNDWREGAGEARVKFPYLGGNRQGPGEDSAAL